MNSTLTGFRPSELDINQGVAFSTPDPVPSRYLHILGRVWREGETIEEESVLLPPIWLSGLQEAIAYSQKLVKLFGGLRY